METIRLIVTVKAYPAASVKYGEAVCVAGIRTDTESPEWVRLYPVEFRELPIYRRFSKWDEIELHVGPSSDSRPESRRPDTSSIKVVRRLGTGRGWAERWPFVAPILEESMCDIARRQREARTSLGAFRPSQVDAVTVDREPDDWSPAQLAHLSRLSLFAQDKEVLREDSMEVALQISLRRSVLWTQPVDYRLGGCCSMAEMAASVRSGRGRRTSTGEVVENVRAYERHDLLRGQSTPPPRVVLGARRVLSAKGTIGLRGRR
jgi:hypothetical protein